MTALGVNQFYDGSTLLEPLSKATDLPIDQVKPVCLLPDFQLCLVAVCVNCISWLLTAKYQGSVGEFHDALNFF